MEPLLYVATPVHDDSVTVGYFGSVLRTYSRFRCRVDMCRGSFLPRNRDILTARFLESGCTHMLCVDSDISWDPDDVQKLLDAKVGFVSGCYAQKDGSNAVTVRLAEPDAVCSTHTDTAIRAVDGTGAGFMLLEFEHVQRMEEEWKHLRYKTRNDEQVTALWAPLFEQGRFDGEDYSFCRRWTRVHGRPWLHTGVVVTHAGSVNYRPNMEAFLQEVA